jgi:hypothetical protein
MHHLRTVSVSVMAIAVTIACAASNDTPGITLPSGVVQPGWQTYTDAAYRFAVSYPEALDILPEATPVANGVRKRIRFQDKHLLSGPFAELEPPRFTIEVSATTGAMSLADWLRSVDRLSAGAIVTPVTLAGAREGVRVQLRQQLAPNEFYSFATSEYVYTLTPLGMYASDMLASFRLL